MMRGLGQGVQSFKKGMNEPIEEDNQSSEKDDSENNAETKEEPDMQNQDDKQ